MITDRTKDDVVIAKKIRSEKVKNFLSLTEKEKQILERGFLTINTLNRISSKQKEVQEKINNLGYFNTSIIVKKWTKEDVFKVRDLEILINNNIILKNAFYVLFETPTIIRLRYHYEDFNTLEKMLVDLESVIVYVQEHYKECGTFNCGEV